MFFQWRKTAYGLYLYRPATIYPASYCSCEPANTPHSWDPVLLSIDKDDVTAVPGALLWWPTNRIQGQDCWCRCANSRSNTPFVVLLTSVTCEPGWYLFTLLPHFHNFGNLHWFKQFQLWCSGHLNGEIVAWADSGVLEGGWHARDSCLSFQRDGLAWSGCHEPTEGAYLCGKYGDCTSLIWTCTNLAATLFAVEICTFVWKHMHICKYLIHVRTAPASPP